MDMNIVDAVRKNDKSALRLLLDAGVDPDSWDSETGESILSIAAADGKSEIVDLLLRAGADPDSRVTVTPPIIAAAAEGFGAIVAELLHFYAEVDATDEDGATALMHAASCGCGDLVKTLIEAGASATRRDRYGNSALILAAECRHSHLIEVLSPISISEDVEQAQGILDRSSLAARESDVTKLLEAASDSDTKSIRSYLQNGGDVDMSDNTGFSALMAAAQFGCLDVLQMLVDAGANLEQVEDHGVIALGYAVIARRKTAFEYLLRLTKQSRRRNEAIEIAKIHTKTRRWKD